MGNQRLQGNDLVTVLIALLFNVFPFAHSNIQNLIKYLYGYSEYLTLKIKGDEIF